MSLQRWSTTLEQQQLHNSLTRLLEGESILVDRMMDYSSSSSFSFVEFLLLSSESSMLLTLSSSSSSSSLSSSLSSSSSHEDMSTDNDSIEDQEQSFLQLTIEEQWQANVVLAPFQDHSFNWGRGPVVTDLSQSNCIENCHMRKEHLTTICQKLWP